MGFNMNRIKAILVLIVGMLMLAIGGCSSETPQITVTVKEPENP
jgi:hypothetical protein